MKYINNERNIEFISVLEDKDNASMFLDILKIKNIKL